MFCCILCINSIHENDTIGLNMLVASSNVREIIREHFWFANVSYSNIKYVFSKVALYIFRKFLMQARKKNKSFVKHVG